MAEQDQPRGIDVSNYGLQAMERPVDLTRLTEIASPLGQLSERLALVMRDFPLVARVRISVTGESKLSGEITLNSTEPNGSIDITVEGMLGRDIPKIPDGDPFGAKMDGMVYFQPAPGKAPYAKTGDIVHEGDPLLWFIGDDKNIQYRIEAPLSGRVTYVVKNEQRVKAEVKDLGPDGKEVITQPATILLYIDPVKE